MSYYFGMDGWMALGNLEADGQCFYFEQYIAFLLFELGPLLGNFEIDILDNCICFWMNK